MYKCVVAFTFLPLLAPLVLAQPGFEDRLDPIAQELDKDNDGELSAAEIKEAAASLKALDENKDGNLTLDELLPGFPPGRGGCPYC